VCRHGTLSGESTKDTHEIDKVAYEWNGNNLVDCFGQIIKREGKVGKDIGVGSNERKRTRCSSEETSVLSEIEKCDRGGGSTKSLETIAKGVPFLK